MQFLVSVLTEDHDLPDQSDPAVQAEMAAVDEFNERLREDGHLVFAGGLVDPARATVVDNRAGSPQITPGPFVENREFVAGMWVIEAPDADVALRLAAEGSKACNRRVQLRPFL